MSARLIIIQFWLRLELYALLMFFSDKTYFLELLLTVSGTDGLEGGVMLRNGLRTVLLPRSS